MSLYDADEDKIIGGKKNQKNPPKNVEDNM